jgi:tRNA (guanine37-N1)-methyltransferase
MTFHIITIFPDSLSSYLNESIIRRAQDKKKIRVKIYNPRDYTRDKHKKVDHRPYAGGPGMVLAVEPLVRTVEKIRKSLKGQPAKVVIFSPGGKQFTNSLAETFSKKTKHLILVCGRYEGIDARVKKIYRAEELSIGPYVLTGGELPAMVVVDAITRRIPGVLGKDESVEERRVASGEVYTRPEVFEHQGKKYRVPKVLLTGDHKKIEEWKHGKKK